MTIILFLVDTSSSMCQKAYVNGVQKTYLDIAKGAVETFLKYRQRTQDCLGDRYMLLTFEEPPANVKAGWKENHATFMNELKNLQSHGLTSMGESLRNAFDLLNLNRMQSGIDTYGQGRCPFYLEPSVIIVITDGGRYSYRNGVHQEIILPLSNQIPGTKFTKEPFRWDQRLFSLVLRMPGNKIDERVDGKVPHDDSPIERMCEVTGGRSYRVRSHYVLNQCIESLVQKVQPGVVLQFEPLLLPKETPTGQVGSGGNAGAGAIQGAAGGGAGGAGSGSVSATSSSSSASSSSSSSTAATSGGGSGGGSAAGEAITDIVFQPVKKMIYVQKHITQKTFPIGYWPLPEPYWPDSKAITLPPRDAHPKLKILTPAVDEPQLVRSFPVDKYEIEGCPLTLQILNKREMNKCWQVIVTNGMHGFELPFGYLKASPNFTQVHLYVLAYNYPALLPLLHDLIHKYNMSPPNDLMYKFNAYVRSIPPYYCPFLRKALVNINVPYQLLQFLLPENVDNYLSPTIANQLKHIKNTAKQDQENLCLKVYKQLKQPKPPYRQVETAKLCTGAALRRDLVRHPLLRDTFAKLHAEIEPVENYTIVVPQLTHQLSAKTYRNPFDIPRRDLIEEIARMRETFLRPASLVAKDSGHCLPIAEMGNYQEYLKNKDNPLREIEPTNVRQHMFGNPYKKDKHMVMVDEADLSDVAPMKSPNGNGPGGAPPPGSGSGSASGSPTGPGQSSPSPGGPGVGQSASGLIMGGGGGGGGGLSKKLDGTARGRKRKAGPLPRAFEFRRMSTDSRSACSSPVPSPTTTSSSVPAGTPIPGALPSGLGLGLGLGCDSATPADNSPGSSCFDEDSNSSCSSSTNSSFASSSSTALEQRESPNDSGLSLGHPDRLSIGFDFSEEETGDQDTPLNGYVHNFINGISEEAMGAVDTDATAESATSASSSAATATTTTTAASCSTPAAVSVIAPAEPPQEATPSPTAAGAATTSNGNDASCPAVVSASSSGSGNFGSGCSSSISSSSSGVLYVPLNGLTTHAAYSSNLGGLSSSPLDSLSSLSSSRPGLLPLANGYGHGHGAVAISPPSPLSPPASSSSALSATSTSSSSSSSAFSHFSHNDINDASEISRILQTCHNGTSSSSSGAGASNSSSSSSSGSNNLNGNGSSSGGSTSSSADSGLAENHYSLGGNSFDALKRVGGVGGNPHYYWASGLNHHNNSSSGSSSSSSNTSNNNNNNNNHRSHNNSSPSKLLDSPGSAVKGGSCGSSPTHNNGGEVSPPPPLTLSEEQREAARRHNIDLRLQIFRDIRRPGRDYSQLLEHLNLVKGDHDMQSEFVDMCIGESLRFRRHRMVCSIQDWWEEKQQPTPTVAAVAEQAVAKS